MKATKLKLGSATLTEAMILMRPTFCIWAEEKCDLTTQSSNSEWSFGSGAGACSTDDSEEEEVLGPGEGERRGQEAHGGGPCGTVGEGGPCAEPVEFLGI